MNPREPRDSLNRPFYLPRLAREHYQGDASVHWTLTLQHRASGWLNPAFHRIFRELMLHVAAREGVYCPVYCLMPDHLHLIWIGSKRDTDQLNGMAFLRTYLEPALAPDRFQSQAHDHVLREHERKRDTFSKACFYVLANPVRAELVDSPEKWSFSGCVLPGYPKLHPLDEDYWPLFWKLWTENRDSDAGSVFRPR